MRREFGPEEENEKSRTMKSFMVYNLYRLTLR
jgi:hypothetical protein